MVRALLCGLRQKFLCFLGEVDRLCYLDKNDPVAHNFICPVSLEVITRTTQENN